tara:strand:- start:347 stop:577 length:231 start_codon:yes stop_codon:yes gene_type:complete
MREKYTNVIRKLVSVVGASHLSETLRVSLDQVRKWSYGEEQIPSHVEVRMIAYFEEIKFVNEARKRKTGVFILFED